MAERKINVKSMLVNFSGHALSESALCLLENDYSKVVNARPIELVFDEDIEKQIADLVSGLPEKIDGTSVLSIIPPGQATYAILLVSYLHGLVGHFPNICYLQRSSEGVYLPHSNFIVQPYEIRASGRKFRQVLHQQKSMESQAKDQSP